MGAGNFAVLLLALSMGGGHAGKAGIVGGRKKCPPMKEAPPRPTGNNALMYNGVSWPTRCYEGNTNYEDFFLIGDYGGILCNHKYRLPNGKWSNGMGWACKERWRKDQYVIPANNIKPGNDRKRFQMARDMNPQQLTAAAMQRHAVKHRPRFILNGGDNFYFGGLDLTCGTIPMDQIHERTQVQFDHVFEKMYAGDGLDDVPWFGCLGNHDWGGMHFEAAWDQQIAYTWNPNSTGRWFLPGLYWHQRVEFPDLDTAMDIFMVDTNEHDAKPTAEDKAHNICGRGNSCGRVGGPQNAYTCYLWFKKLHDDQAAWLDKKLTESDADWQIIVTHFPVQWGMSYWREVNRKHGIDLFVGSHRHMQEIYGPGTNEYRWVNMPWVVIGGGGGITSEWNPGHDERGLRQYGFMHCMVNKTHMTVKSYSEEGRVSQIMHIEPKEGEGEPTCEHYGCGNLDKAGQPTGVHQEWQGCQCHADCWSKFWPQKAKCCRDFRPKCTALQTCATYGCSARYDRNRPCQCTKDCAKHNSCCSDFQELCMSPEAVAAEEQCGAPCTVEGQNGDYSCMERVNFMMRTQRKSAARAIEEINEECEGQCTCQEKYFSRAEADIGGPEVNISRMSQDLGGPAIDMSDEPSLKQEEALAQLLSLGDDEELPKRPEPNQKTVELLEKRERLQEELEQIHSKLDPGYDPLEKAYSEAQWGDHAMGANEEGCGAKLRF